MSPNPNQLDYAPPRRRRPPFSPSPLGAFLLGLVAGSVMSGIVWGMGWETLERGGGMEWAIYGVVGTKFLLAVILLCFEDLRGYGAGLLVSLVIGFMIFFSVCFSHF